MKAKNSEKIIRGYLEFAGGLLISTALSMALLTGFIHTNGSEYKLMESKTQEYDKIYARQIALVDKVDSLYNYLVLMGSNDGESGGAPKSYQYTQDGTYRGTANNG